MMDGLRSDMMDVTPYANADMRALNDHMLSPGNEFTDPADFYKIIVNINEVLSHADELAENDRFITPYILSIIKGDLTAMRAFTYLTLVRLFNEAAYIEDNLLTLPENLSQNILNKADMIDTLINQLKPYVYVPNSGTELVEYTFPHFVNTKAMIGELYLERGDYALAAEHLKLACESYFNQLSLLKVDRTYSNGGWETIFLNSESAEIENISVIPFSSIENQNNPLAAWMGHNYDYMVKPSAVLIDSFMAQIPSSGLPGDQWRGRGVTFRLDTLSKESETVFTTESYITKYEVDPNDPFGTDIIISRAADLHLMLAEAYNRMGDEVSEGYALMLLNQGVSSTNPKPSEFAKWTRNIGIRGRAGLEPRVVADTLALAGEDRIRYIEDLIIAERALELAYEGKRFFDLVRVAERRNEPEFLADKVAAKFEGTPQYEQIKAHLMNPDSWYLPLN
jgi:tetratricopeptide (TPR) repeat protein